MVANFEFGITGRHDRHVIDDAAALNFSIGALDEPVLVDPSVATQGRDQPDVRTFRRFDRADPAIVRRVNVADFESSALARETSRPEGRKTPLMSDLRKRIRLVHELRQLRRPEEFADGRYHRLGVDEIVGHRGDHFLVHRHLFLDGAFHADQSDPELVLQEFAHGSNTTIAEVIDVVHLANVLAKLQQITDNRVEVARLPIFRFAPQNALIERRRQIQLDVELHAPDLRKIVLSRIEEHTVEQRCRSFQRRRIAGTQLAVDFDQGFLLGLDRVFSQCLRQNNADVIPLREKNRQFGHTRIHNTGDQGLSQFVVCLDDNLARIGIDDICRGKSALEVLGADFEPFDFRLLDVRKNRRSEFLPRVQEHFLRLRVRDVLGNLQALFLDIVRERPEQLLVFDRNSSRGVLVEFPDDFLFGVQTQGSQEDRRQEFSFAIDTHIKEVLGGFVFKLHPRSPVRNNLSEEVGLGGGGFEKDSWAAVQLADDDTLGAVDDEGTVVGHERDFTEVNFLLLDVANCLGAGFRIFVEDRQADDDLQGRSVGHAAFLALRNVVLQVELDGVAALVTEGDLVLVLGTALRAHHRGLGGEGVYRD